MEVQSTNIFQGTILSFMLVQLIDVNSIPQKRMAQNFRISDGLIAKKKQTEETIR